MLGIPGLTYYQTLKLASALKKNHCQNTIFLSKINRMLDNELILLAPDLQVSQNELDLNKKTEQSLEDQTHGKELISSKAAVSLQLIEINSFTQIFSSILSTKKAPIWNILKLKKP